MKQTGSYSSSTIEKAVDALQKLRPAYVNILDFYKKIFITQEEAAQHLQLEPIQIPEHVLAIKIKEGFPLIQMSEFVLDIDASDRLLEVLCHMASTANEVLSTAASGISKAMQTGSIKSDLLYKKLLESDDDYFQKVAHELGIEKRVLTFFVYTSVKPSLAVCARKLSSHLASLDAWPKGICPVCGNFPGLATLEEKGERWLFCSFCWTKWHVQRIFCAFCENEDQQTLHYFYTETESEYRVDTCDKCKNYLKTVDLRKIERVFYPPLEQVSTLHLDMKAGEMGYQNPMDLFHTVSKRI
jgi:FdhE protein